MSAPGGSTWRTAGLGVAVAALLGAMFVTVRRDGSARNVIAATDSLRQEAREAREALGRARRRADSLASRRRILEAAGRMGFRAPADTEVRLLPDVSRRSADGDGSEGSE